MDATELEAALSNLLTEMEGEQGDRHEIYLRLMQILSGMRAFGMPLPDDLVRLEYELEAEFRSDTETAASAEGKAPRSSSRRKAEE